MAANGSLIAVVDDESPVRVMLGRVLRLAHFEVAAFDSGEAFLGSQAAQGAACAILDIHMPGLTGFEVQARLRDAHSRVPVVFITASDEASLARTAAEVGAAGLLRKPFSSAELLHAIGVALGRPTPDP